jgi:hypothetical protein
VEVSPAERLRRTYSWNAVTLPPITRLTFRYRYSEFLPFIFNTPCEDARFLPEAEIQSALSMDACSSLHRRLHTVALVRSPLQSRQQAMDVACLTQSFQCGIIETRESWNKTFPRQVFSIAARSRFVPMREREDAPELHSVQKRKVATTPDRNSYGKTFAHCGGRIWPGCFLVPSACSRSGISLVRVARKLPLLLL